MSHDINGLRDRLFAALDGLADKEKPMEIDRAKAIADVARVLVDSAKAEIQMLQVTGARGAATEFVPVPTVAAQPRLAKPKPEAGGCPSCGGRLRPETNGGGQLVDRCVDCDRIVSPARQAAKAS